MQAVINLYDRSEPVTYPMLGGTGLFVLALHAIVIAWILFQGAGISKPAPEQTMMVMMIPAPEQPVAPPVLPPPPIPEQPPIVKSVRQVEPPPSAPVVREEPEVVPDVKEAPKEQLPVAAASVVDAAAPATPSVPVIPIASVRMAYLNNKMVYPDHLRRRGIQGKAVVKVLVSPEGRVLQIELAKSSGNTELDNAALKGVRDWKFAPFTGPGAVPSSAIVPINFELK